LNCEVKERRKGDEEGRTDRSKHKVCVLASRVRCKYAMFARAVIRIIWVCVCV
jgi:hypothetical protein